MKKAAVVAAAVSVVAFAALAYGDMESQGVKSEIIAGCGMDGQMIAVENDISKHLADINLDEQQKNIIGKIKSKMTKETIKRTAEMRIVQVEIKDFLNHDPVNVQAVEAEVKKLGMLKTDIYISHILAMEEIKANLTYEQRKTFKKLVEFGPIIDAMGVKYDQVHDTKEK
jgi:Spy/CpxP family protein refolding chaperone